jgi:hypothetical protein
MQGETGAGVAAHGSGVGGGADHASRASIRVFEGATEQLVSDSLTTILFVHREQREDPNFFAHKGECYSDYPVSVDCYPRSIRIVLDKMRVPVYALLHFLWGAILDPLSLLGGFV